LVKQGTGTLTLSGANTYSGGTTVSAGTLRGTTTSLQGDITNNATVTFDQAGSGTYAGILSGTGALTKTGTGTVMLSGANTYAGTTTISAGRLEVNGSLVGPVTNQTGGTLSGIGQIGTFENFGQVAPGNSIGTLVVNGNFTSQANSEYEVEIDPNGNSDLIQVTGSATLNGGIVEVQPLGSGFIPGTDYTILTAAGGVSGTLGSLSHNFAFLTPTLTHLSHSVLLRLTRNSINFADLADTSNQLAVATKLDTLSAGATGDMDSVINMLWGLNADQARDAFRQIGTGAQFKGSLISAVETSTNLYLQTLRRRAWGLRQGRKQTLQDLQAQSFTSQSGHTDLDQAIGTFRLPGTVDRSPFHHTTGEFPLWKPGFWMQGLGVYGKLSDGSNIAGFEFHNEGVLLGVDKRLGSSWLFGIVGGYTTTNVTFEGTPNTHTIDSYLLGLYSSFSRGAPYIDSGVTLAFNHYDNERHIAFGTLDRTAASTFNGYKASMYLESGHRWSSHYMEIQPLLALHYSYLHQQGSTESGAQSLNLSVDDFTAHSFRTSLGLRVAIPVYLGPETEVIGDIWGRWNRKIFESDYELSARFADVPSHVFRIQSYQPRENRGILGTSIMGSLGSRYQVGMSYYSQISDRLVTHTLTGNIGFSW
ncbi:MAG: autotransporter domain-containing protein, partial [Nitrospira sp.]|nr:autotransporter domain-containing protein [Nitrospira sp.]